jgi:hypothetical protein
MMTWGLAKKMTFHKLEPLFEGFCYEYLIKRMLSLRLKGLSHEIDFKTFDKNLKNLA